MIMEGGEKFDPTAHKGNALEAFNEFVADFHYTYDSLGRLPPVTENTEILREQWREQDRRKVFLGKYVETSMRRKYEDITSEIDRPTMTFTAMVAIFRTAFERNTSKTLANFKFRQIKQKQGEAFDQFVIRVKKESKSCGFKCASEACTAADIMIRDQILIGTADDMLRERALAENLTLEDLIGRGESMEAAASGSRKLKIKEEPKEQKVNKMQAGKYSKKGRNTQNFRKDDKNQVKCKNCSSSRCKDPNKCPARKATCFDCNKSGHYKGSPACKISGSKNKKKNVRKTDEDSGESSDSFLA